MKREEFGTRLLTRVYANTQLQLMFWQMTYTKHRHVTKKLQSHTCYLTRMLDTIQHRAAADNYVRIANRLHLIRNFKRLLALLKLGSELRFYELRECHLVKNIYYFGGARSKGFATLRNVSKLQFFDKIGQAKSVGFRFYSAI